MIPRSTALRAFLLLLLGAGPDIGPASAQSRPATPADAVPGYLATAISACVREVRHAQPRPDGQAAFDAFVRINGKIVDTGGPAERQLFRQCMQQKGVESN